MRVTTLNGIAGLDYIDLKNVPIRVSKDKAIGSVITANLGDIERFVAVELIKNRIPLRGREVSFLRRSIGMSMEKFAVSLGLTAASIFKWERTSNKRLALINEFAVRAFIAERMKLDFPIKFLDLSEQSESPSKLILNWKDGSNKRKAA